MKSRFLELNLRRRVRDDGGNFIEKHETVRWDATQTAAIVCDMWDDHWCRGAAARVAELAPRMNELLGTLREKGVFIIHAPSGTMKYYEEHQGRKLAQSAPKANNLPPDISKWCSQMESEKDATWPVDQSDGGCDCTPICEQGSPWRKQIDSIEIRDGDAITDSGEEVWNLLEHRGITNVLMMGVHTNMCVLGRPFGLRNLARYGVNVVLVRDMTDSMYNSRSFPFVNHFRGTELIIEHIEKYVCPTCLSSDFTGNVPFRFEADKRADHD